MSFGRTRARELQDLRLHVARNARRAAIPQECDADKSDNKRLGAPCDRLLEIYGGAADPNDSRFDRQRIVHFSGPEIVDLHSAHRECRRFASLEIALFKAKGAEPFRPRPLHEAQIGCVVDVSRKVRVLIIDSQFEALCPAIELSR